ncbi:hypothetical protein E2P84_20480 [Burkholderia cepacia]|uniref:Uncharacterized protein n=1 Tax=Burkholderia cepacia TaxID=292 RepID=A0AAX2RJF7_BURCE|nr:hypothetical protein [Burkholderia cepacia]TES73984.1 hypothetical protein E2P84_20480 [Burkholderia cepacia]TET05342.1 hypothetical protein E3D36_00075 [Burkholderia cepacia]TEU40315.1 hypothetical protein E3D37_28855 [Burkholderia cepacia]TEU42424.1 hypothetical protein E3D39_15815 [Burkholderia cepacia]TEU57451.1 hypothetical protein E3D38_03220 [Burkholderia cepacia]
MKDIDQIRRDNLKIIEAERGGPAAAATALGMSHSQFTNLRDGAKDSKTGRPRGMRAATARNIENCANKPLGWLDTDHSDSGAHQPAAMPAGWEQLNPSQRAQVESFIGWLLSQPAGQSNDTPSSSKRFGKGG